MFELWRLLGSPAKGRFAAALGLSAAAGAAGIVLLGLSGWFLTAAALAGLSGGGYVFNHLYPSAGVRASAFARVLARYGEQLIGHDATLGLSARLRPALFEAEAGRRRGFTPLPASDLSAIIDDVSTAEAGFLRVLSPLAALGASVLVALGFAFAADGIGGFVALAAFALVGFLLPRQLTRRGRRNAQILAEKAEGAREETARLVENAVELETMGALSRASEEVRATLDGWLGLRLAGDLPFRRLSVLTGMAGALTALFLVWRGTTGEADLALSVAAALALIAAMDATAAMVAILNAASTSARAAQRLVKRLERSEADWNPSKSKAQVLKSLFPIEAGDLVASADDEAPQIGPVSFTLHAGEVIQLVGPSGGGKSTLAETLMRLHPTVSGRLSYGGVPAERLRLASVLAEMAYAPQLPAFLPGTLRDQFLLAKPDASDEEIETALFTACADTFVADSPRGLDSLFTETDQPFSGGELRRIGIARALLVRPALLILDEPFAGLDPALAERLKDRLSDWQKAGERSLLLLGHAPVPLPGCAGSVIWL